MNTLKIYFITEKIKKPSPSAENIMRIAVTGNYNAQKPNYLATTIEELNDNKEVRDSVEEIVSKETIEYEDISFDSQIKVIQDENSFFRTTPAHTYELKLTLKSVVYYCVKIIDETKFLCYTTNDNEIKTIVKGRESKVYVIK